jgi:enamine deaminase RidA (YjgF/YER057c/UK114 family)
MSADARLTELGIDLPEPFSPAGAYVPAVTTGNLVFLSGQGPLSREGGIIGKVGAGVDLDTAKEAARRCGLQLLAALRQEIGSLDRVTRIVKLLGMVNCAPGFNDTPTVVNGCSELLIDVFGEGIGRHARSAVGMAELPFDIAVEIEMVVEIAPE